MTRNTARIATATIALLLAPGSGEANPQGGTVVGGSATISQPAPNNLRVNQLSDKAIINWQSFSIGASESVRFQQPSSSSVVLNRVIGGDPSTIAGQLSANGIVFLVNPNGVVFTSSARIDVNGLIATTHDIPNADFMAGRFNFTLPGNPAAGIVNQGTITAAEGGLVGLVAPWVRNDGVIAARLGKVALASGNAFALDLYGDQLIQFAVPATAVAQVAPSGALITNTGTINADGGTVWIGADTARQVVDQAINTTGIIEARAVHQQGGEIVLDGGASGVAVAGTLDTSGAGSGQAGGTVKVLGTQVALNRGANVNVAGDAGGGTAFVGGNFHGAGPEQNARTTTIASGASIDADAVTAGNGGQVAVWSDQATTFQGAVSARGGTQGGNGGHVEVSGHQLLNFLGTVNLTAPKGDWGTLLLDPENVTLAASSNSPTLPSSGDTTLIPTSDNSVLSVSTLQSALALGNVTVTTGSSGSQTGDIEVSSNISWSNGSALTLSAYRNITVDTGTTISNTGSGNLSLRADNSGIGTGSVTFSGTGKINYAGSTGTVSISYDPSDNPAGSVVNSTSYTSPVSYASAVSTNGGVSNQLIAYMLVNTAYDLQNIQNNLSGNYALGKNIDASATASWNGGAGFLPMGTFYNGFAGMFDGLYKTIDSLSINSSTTYAGLFGEIGPTGDVRNVGITNVSVKGATGAAAGGLASGNRGTIEQSYATGTIGPIVNGPVGGLVGENIGTITDSHASVQLSGGSTAFNTTQLGGLVGDNNATGGTVATITTSYATGSVTSQGNNLNGIVKLGGLIGTNDQNGTFHTTTTNDYWDNQTSGQSNATGNGALSGVSGLSTAMLQLGSLPTGFSSSVWAATAGSYPTLRGGSSGTQTNVNFPTASSSSSSSSSSQTQQVLNQADSLTAFTTASLTSPSIERIFGSRLVASQSTPPFTNIPEARIAASTLLNGISNNITPAVRSVVEEVLSDAFANAAILGLPPQMFTDSAVVTQIQQVIVEQFAGSTVSVASGVLIGVSAGIVGDKIGQILADAWGQSMQGKVPAVVLDADKAIMQLAIADVIGTTLGALEGSAVGTAAGTAIEPGGGTVVLGGSGAAVGGAEGLLGATFSFLGSQLIGIGENFFSTQ